MSELHDFLSFMGKELARFTARACRARKGATAVTCADMNESVDEPNGNYGRSRKLDDFAPHEKGWVFHFRDVSHRDHLPADNSLITVSIGDLVSRVALRNPFVTSGAVRSFPF